MEIQHLTQKQLSERWQLSEASLERWRSARSGPAYLKLNGRILYRRLDIESYEMQCLQPGQPATAAVSPAAVSTYDTNSLATTTTPS
jgi:hypothetical protein